MLAAISVFLLGLGVVGDSASVYKETANQQDLASRPVTQPERTAAQSPASDRQ